MKINKNIITILLPCKNPHLDYLTEAVESVLSQTNQKWNLLIINEKEDSDRTLRALQDYRNNPKIQIINNESRLLSGALNTGMRRADTEYVCELLSDDVLNNRAIEILADNIKKNPDIDFYHSSRRIIDEKGGFISGIYMSKKVFDVRDFVNGSPVKHLLCWNRKKALEIGGIDESLGLHGADDYDFPWCMAEAGCRFKSVPDCLYYYRDHREAFRLTTHIPLSDQIEELRKIWKKHGLSQKEVKNQIKKRTAGYLKQALFFDEADKKYKERIGYDPKKGWKDKYL